MTTIIDMPDKLDAFIEALGKTVLQPGGQSKSMSLVDVAEQAELNGQTPKPDSFVMTLSSKESSDIYSALRRGLWLAKEAEKNGMIGASGYIGQIADALEIVDRPMERVPGETQAQRNASVRESLESYFANHHCD